MVDPALAANIALLVAGFVVIEGLWLAFLTYNMLRAARTRKAEEQAQLEAERRTVIEDIFLLHRSGILLKHYTRRLRPNVDSDLLSGMLVAVQEFIKDTFREEKGKLNEIRFGEMRLVIVEGRWTILAGIVRGERVADILPQLRAAMRDLETKYDDPLAHWEGDMDSLPEVTRVLDDLVEGKYRDAAPAPEPPRVLARAVSKG